MTKRVQHVRHDNAGANAFAGLLGEITVNTGNKSVHVHDGVTPGGNELAAADLANAAAATVSNAGKMTATQVADLEQALLDIITNAGDIATNAANTATNTSDIATNTSDIATLQSTQATKADKAVPAAAGNVATLNVSGNLTDSGVAGADIFALPGGNVNFMLFYQAAAPTGWTKSVTHNDKSLRVVSGTGGGNGGNHAFSAVFSTSKATASHTLVEAEIPAHDHGAAGAHTHGQTGYTGGSDSVFGFAYGGGFGSEQATYPATQSNGSHTHSSFGGGGGHSHNISNFDLQFVDVIIASRD